MKRYAILLLALLLVPAFSAWAEFHGSEGEGGGRSGGSSAPVGHAAAPAGRPAPVVINMNHGASGGHNRNFPSQQAPRSASAPAVHASYGQLHWNQSTVGHPVAEAVVGQSYQRPNVQSVARPGIRTAVAIHHHPYTQGYVRKKLQKLGVTAEPALITDRGEMIHTDRAHSTIRYPQFGEGHFAITAKVISPRDFTNSLVMSRMAILDSPEWRAKLNQATVSENQPGHYYWHEEGADRYCHFMDESGYHWFGWYNNDQFFWARYFGERWWFYDSDYDRWCFWNNGFWWWQDPYHVADLYCYTDNAYIPCNSGEDQIVVAAPTAQPMQSYVSPDGTRTVRVDTETQDAFLYDTSATPSFDPVYLASGVQTVQFSDISTGRPLQIILKLNDGTFDMFDAQGNSYGPGAYDADQAANSQADNIQTPPPPAADVSGDNAPAAPPASDMPQAPPADQQ